MELKEFIDEIKKYENFESLNVEYTKEGWKLYLKMQNTHVIVEDIDNIDYERILNDVKAVQNIEGLLKWLI